jgi:hypothetical protein
VIGEWSDGVMSRRGRVYLLPMAKSQMAGVVLRPSPI